MSKKEKLLNRFLTLPKDFTYDELVVLLGFFEYYEWVKGKTSGSRRAFVNDETKHIMRLHKPHPKNVLKRYQIKDIIDGLSKAGLL